MGKSNSGGTRSFIKGKVGADVYSIGKDGKGKRQQVIRSLAEQVANPQTLEQMRGRMIMSTVMQAVSALRPIIDHSFDGVAKGQPSISAFIRKNYALVKADVDAHPSSGNMFGLNLYKEKGAKGGKWLISEGSAVWPAGSDPYGGNVNLPYAADATKAGEIRASLGLNVGDYVTIVMIKKDGTGSFVRYIMSDSLADDVVITQGNVSQLFETEGNGSPSVTLDNISFMIGLSADHGAELLAGGQILSVKDGSTWKHSVCEMSPYVRTPAADVALPTYPIGQEQFLNGGDL